jgi:hypothetical protein
MGFSGGDNDRDVGDVRYVIVPYLFRVLKVVVQEDGTDLETVVAECTSDGATWAAFQLFNRA